MRVHVHNVFAHFDRHDHLPSEQRCPRNHLYRSSQLLPDVRRVDGGDGIAHAQTQIIVGGSEIIALSNIRYQAVILADDVGELKRHVADGVRDVDGFRARQAMAQRLPTRARSAIGVRPIFTGEFNVIGMVRALTI